MRKNVLLKALKNVYLISNTAKLNNAHVNFKKPKLYSTALHICWTLYQDSEDKKIADSRHSFHLLQAHNNVGMWSFRMSAVEILVFQVNKGHMQKQDFSWVGGKRQWGEKREPTKKQFSYINIVSGGICFYT